MLKHLQLTIKSAINSFWLLPLWLSIVATMLFALTFYIDSVYLNIFLADYPPPFSIGPTGARQLLATIAGSLITVASLVFSMTLIALTVAAGNIGARLLLRYMQNRSIQITLGVFLAGFIYALLTLSAIGSDADYVPRLSVFTAMAIAVSCFVWLVFAFHDLAKSIQVDQAIAELSASLCLALQRMQEECDGAERVPNAWPEKGLSCRELCGEAGGYVVSINREGVAHLAEQHNLIVRLNVKLGSFVIPGEVLAEVAERDSNSSHKEQVPDWQPMVRDTIILAPSRNDLDDPFFCLRLLNEIAARALSPSLNDFYTALACVDHISVGVEYILKNGMPSNGWRDSSGQLRVIFSPYYFDDFLYAAFDQVRNAGVGTLALTLRLLDRLKRLNALASDDEHKKCIGQFIERVYSSAHETLNTQVDLQSLEQAYDKARRATISEMDGTV